MIAKAREAATLILMRDADRAGIGIESRVGEGQRSDLCFRISCFTLVSKLAKT
jgi:hypothetical protein